MKAIVVYYSLEGNTDHAARQLAAMLGADVLRLETAVPYPLGAKKFLFGGRDSVSGAAPALKPYTFDAEQYDTVIIGTPLWAWNFAPPLRTFLQQHNLQGKKLAFLVTSMGGQDSKCFAHLRESTGASETAPCLSLIEPLKRRSDANTDKLQQFAEKIRQL